MSTTTKPPNPVDPAFLRGVISSTTTYSEGWREVCGRLMWVEEELRASIHGDELREVCELLETHKSDAPTRLAAIRDRVQALRGAAVPKTQRTVGQQIEHYLVEYGDRCLQCGRGVVAAPTTPEALAVDDIDALERRLEKATPTGGPPKGSIHHAKQTQIAALLAALRKELAR